MKHVCANCEIELKPLRNGVYVVEMFGDTPAPYKIWHADLWGCTNCGARIVPMQSYGKAPLAEHWQDGFKDMYENILKAARLEDTAYPGIPGVIYCYETA